MVFRSLKSYLLVAVVTCFLCTFLLSWSCGKTEQKEKKEDGIRKRVETIAEKTATSKHATFLLIAVLSSPGDSAIRAVIRDTWMRLSTKGKDTITVIFPVGTLQLSETERIRLEEERKSYGDLAFLENLKEDYSNLTRKTLQTMIFAHDHYDFSFFLKVDDDSFVRLGALIKSLKDVVHPRLYWGFLDGRAKPIRKGKWKESDWVICDRYVPYQLGGGYVLSYELVSFLARNSALFKLYKNEDVSVGAWLAGIDVKYVHDPRFDTEYMSRGCSNEYLITHKKTPAQMLKLYNSLTSSQRLCDKELQVRPSYVYDWSVPPSQCCRRSEGSRIP